MQTLIVVNQLEYAISVTSPFCCSEENFDERLTHASMKISTLNCRWCVDDDDDEGAFSTNLQKLQTAQNTALRIITGCTADNEIQHLHDETENNTTTSNSTLLNSD